MMSNETDRLVSDTYSELAEEKTPEALNREVLRLAARESRTRYSIARAWMRPVAWAATIGLSLVVVLELTILPEADMAPQSVPAEAVVPADMAGPQAASIKEELMLESEASEERSDALAKRSRPYSPAEQKAEKVTVMNEDPVVIGNAGQAEPASRPADLEDAFEAGDLDDPHGSMERARQQLDQSSLLQMGAARAPAAAASAGLRAESDYLCPAEARLSAETWLMCIEQLEADSPPLLVEREYEELRRRYPDFEQPAADK